MMPGHTSISVEDTIQSGQVFLWRRSGRFWYGINGQDVLRVDGDARIRSLCRLRTDFFRSRDDMRRIIRSISRDAATRTAVGRYAGLRITDQDPFQCLVSFIASSNSSIQKIRACLGRITERFGEKAEFDGMDFFLFPDPETLARAPLRDIAGCGAGYRSGFIKSAARMVAGGQIDLDGMRKADYACAKETICGIPGVGDKVADCVMLFSLDKLEAFPLDRWMMRILRRYHPGFEPGTKTLTQKQYGLLHQKIVKHFGPYAGYAQQYLFKMERDESGRAWL